MNNPLKVMGPLLVLWAMALAVAAPAVADVKQLAATCVACHGPKGISNNDLWPNLAGQHEIYLIDQMKAFRDGSRKDPLMSATAKTLSDADIEQLAAYFSGLSDKQPPVRGKENMAGKSVSGACISCHGMWGKPVNSQWPVISGQKKGYLEKQLKDFRDGTRESPVMSVIVKGFTDQQIKDVAEYYSQFRRD